MKGHLLEARLNLIEGGLSASGVDMSREDMMAAVSVNAPLYPESSNATWVVFCRIAHELAIRFVHQPDYRKTASLVYLDRVRGVLLRMEQRDTDLQDLYIRNVEVILERVFYILRDAEADGVVVDPATFDAVSALYLQYALEKWERGL